MITIVIPVKDEPLLDAFIEGNKRILKSYPVIVIDSGGGEKLKEIAHLYLKQNVSIWKARQLGYYYVSEPYILNLDADVIVPERFIEEALEKLKDEDVAVVAIDYEEPLGHLAYGPSLWKADILKELYDYEPKPNRGCECRWMWKKVREAGFRVETLRMRAKHLKVKNND